MTESVRQTHKFTVSIQKSLKTYSIVSYPSVQQRIPVGGHWLGVPFATNYHTRLMHSFCVARGVLTWKNPILNDFHGSGPLRRCLTERKSLGKLKVAGSCAGSMRKLRIHDALRLHGADGLVLVSCSGKRSYFSRGYLDYSNAKGRHWLVIVNFKQWKV